MYQMSGEMCAVCWVRCVPFVKYKLEIQLRYNSQNKAPFHPLRVADDAATILYSVLC